MQATRVQHYIDRARDFHKGMQLVRGDELYESTAALLAIHSAISYSDALRTGLGDTNLKSYGHVDAVKSLLRLLQERDWTDVSGSKHLRYLISQKSLVAYGNVRLDARVAGRLAVKAEQFASWVNRIGSRLNLEGWTHDD